MRCYFMISAILATACASSADSNVCDVRGARWKAAGDNATDDTAAIQAAIDDCRREQPHGAVVLLSGPATYRVTASLALTSNLTLRLDAHTTLFSAFTPYMAVKQNPRCSTTSWPHGPTAVLCGTNLTNVAVIGAGMNTSVLDGGGWPWYNYTAVVGGGLGGPRLFEPVWSTNVTLAHLTLQWSAGWTVHPTFCTGVLAHHIYIHNPRPVGNTDGFDPDSCTDVVLHDAIIDTGDDGISIKSGNSTACKTCGHIQMPAKNIHIYRTNILSRNFCVGSATFGGFGKSLLPRICSRTLMGCLAPFRSGGRSTPSATSRCGRLLLTLSADVRSSDDVIAFEGGVVDLVMEDCTIGDDEGSSPWAFKYKSHQNYAGKMVNHTFRRIRVGKIAANTYQQPHGGYFLSIQLRYHPLIPNRTCSINRATGEGNCPIFKDISFEDISIKGADCAGNIAGFKGDLIEGLTFRNVTFDTPPKDGWRCGYVDPKTFSSGGMTPALQCSPGPPDAPPANCFA